MTLQEQLKALAGTQDYSLTDEEYQAVYDWINAEKDDLPYPLKEGLLKLLNGEMYRRM